MHNFPGHGEASSRGSFALGQTGDFLPHDLTPKPVRVKQGLNRYSLSKTPHGAIAEVFETADFVRLTPQPVAEREKTRPRILEDIIHQKPLRLRPVVDDLVGIRGN